MKPEGSKAASLRHAGFSLVELMVAMGLGLIVTLAAVQVFSVNQRSFQLQQAMMRLQEDGQLAVRFMADDIRLTGLAGDDLAPAVEPGIVRDAVSIGGQVFPASQNGTSGGNDRLTIAYHGEADCEGSLASGGRAMLVNTYWVENEALRCNGSLTGGAGIVLLEGVEGFQVLYGLRAADAGAPRVEQFVPANQVGSRQVIAVKFALLLRGDDLPAGPVGEAKRVVLLDEEVNVNADRAVRRMFQRSVALRNFNWDDV